MKWKIQFIPSIFIIIAFHLFVTKLAAEISPSFQWDFTKPDTNVNTFVKFINHIYTNYDEKAAGYSDKQKKAIFNFTFVKYAAEIAIFRVLKNQIKDGEAVPNLGVDQEDGSSVKESVCFLHYDQNLGHHIANEFNKTVFCSAEKQIVNSVVVSQILQLTVSFAIRIVLSVIYDNYFTNFYDLCGWQLETLLSAFKILTKYREGTTKHGIFPFQIIKIDSKGRHLWTGMIKQKQGLLSPFISKQQQYIENFKFVINLYKFTLSYYDVFMVLQVIRIKSKMSSSSSSNEFGTNSFEEQNNEGPALAFYTFMAQHFRKKLYSSFEQSIGLGNSYNNKIDCAFVHLGNALLSRVQYPISDYAFTDFVEFAKEKEKECGKTAHREFDINSRDNNISDDNSPACK